MIYAASDQVLLGFTLTIRTGTSELTLKIIDGGFVPVSNLAGRAIAHCLSKSSQKSYFEHFREKVPTWDLKSNQYVTIFTFVVLVG